MPINISYRGQTFQITGTSNIFQAVATQTLTASIDLWPKVCDQTRGYYKIAPNSSCIIPRASSCKRMAIIVESPHKDEFDSNFNPLVPLNGVSGIRFASKILPKLNFWFSSNCNYQWSSCSPFDLEIKIFNPIQYQASLYHFLNGKISYNNFGSFAYNSIDSDLRDKVWRCLFHDCQLKDDFISRLSSYNPDFIINCCTGSSSYTRFNMPLRRYRSVLKLKSNVRSELLNCNIIQTTSQKYLEDTHPLAW